MKTYPEPATSKLITRFDNKLRNLLIEDIKAFREKNPFLNNNQAAEKQLKAA